MFVRKFAASTFQNDRLARFLSSIMSNIELQTKLDLKVDLPTSPPLSVQFYQHVILTYIVHHWGQFSQKKIYQATSSKLKKKSFNFIKPQFKFF